MKISFITIFPDQIKANLEYGLFRIAASKELVTYQVYDLRDWTDDVHRSVDDTPYGGGAGMVLRYDVFDRALADIKTDDSYTVAMTASGYKLTQPELRTWYEGELHDIEDLIILCGHYEGFDQRILDNLVDKEISIGDYVLSSGELSGMVLTDAILRIIPGALGNDDSHTDESFEDGDLEYPHYTRPHTYKGHIVPEILLSGNHAEIAKWRKQKSKELTQKRRPDLS